MEKIKVEIDKEKQLIVAEACKKAGFNAYYSNGFFDGYNFSQLQSKASNCCCKSETVAINVIYERTYKLFHGYTCTKCDNHIHFESKYCSGCGSKLEWIK